MPLPGRESTGAERLRELAAESEGTASADPESARSLATWVIEHSDDPVALVRAHRAVGIAERTMKHAEEMETAFLRAVAIATESHLDDERAFSEVLLASAQQIRGRTPDALETLARAIPDLAGERRLLAEIQLGIVRAQSGDYLGGLETLEPLGGRILELAPMRQAIFHTNCATCLLQTGRAAEAIEAFERSVELYGDAGEPHLASNTLHNLARAYAAAGEVVGALRCFERIDALDIGPAAGVDLVDRASVLLTAGLLEEAEVAAKRAQAAASGGADAEWHPVAAMLLAQTLEALGDHDAAVAPAREAVALFERQARPNLRDLAEAVELRCLAATGAGDAVTERSDDTASRLARWGAATDAMTLRLGVARRSDDSRFVRAQLEAALEIDADGIEARMLAAEATARLADLDSDVDQVFEVAIDAFAALDEWRRTIGSTELQARVARQGAHLADVGVGVAFASQDAEAALATVEQLRMLSLVSTVDRSEDGELNRLLVEYRSLGSHPETGGQQEARARLEQRIRELGRLAQPSATLAPRPDLQAALDRLGDCLLVELVDHRGSLYAITTEEPGGLRMVELASATDIRREVDSLRSAITRLSSPRTSPASRDAFATVFDASAAILSDWIFGSMDLDQRESVLVVPSRSLAFLPWSALPALSDTAFTVAPSLRLWATMDIRPVTVDGDVVAVGLDDPPYAADEARMVAELRDGTAIISEDARVDSVLSALNGSSVAHLACHGSFRGDNPLMSSLYMTDGPITVYDFEQLASPPETLVLSACEVAQSQRLAGDALLGMTASLMAAGTRSIIAASTVVSDQAAPDFMAEWHRRHAAGATPAAALATARSIAGDDPTTKAVAASFLCLGA